MGFLVGWVETKVKPKGGRKHLKIQNTSKSAKSDKSTSTGDSDLYSKFDIQFKRRESEFPPTRLAVSGWLSAIR